MQDTAALLLVYVVYPVWVAAGFADWLCHRATNLAGTSGLKENLFHWAMFGQIGAGMAAAAFLEVNAALVVVLLAVFLVHEVTVYLDLAYSTVRRDVGPFEQMVHSFLELLPLVSIALLALMAWPLAGWTLRLKDAPLPMSQLLAAVALSALFNVLPLAQETWSCLRAAKRPARKPPASRIDPRP